MESSMEQPKLDDKEETRSGPLGVGYAIYSQRKEEEHDVEDCDPHCFEYIHEGATIKYFKCKKCGFKDDLPF